jgi:predicted transcriptional regulator
VGQIQLRLPDDVHQGLRILAVASRQPMTSIAVDGLTHWVALHRPACSIATDPGKPDGFEPLAESSAGRRHEK